MLPQMAMIQRLRALCQTDERVVAATLYGSFTVGEADQYSDIECVLFFDAAAVGRVDKQAWVNQIAPTLLFFADDFGHYTAIFDNLVRGEFHFDSVEDLQLVATWQGSAWFPSAESAILVDRTGQLTTAMQPLVGSPPERDTPETVSRLVPNYINLVLFGTNTLRRGELARSLEILGLVHRSLLWMARLVEHTTDHWPTPSKKLEQDLSPERYARLAACTAALDAAALNRAYRAAWLWGQELAAELCARHWLDYPAALCHQISTQSYGEVVP